jgi:hypothetical protein
MILYLLKDLFLLIGGLHLGSLLNLILHGYVQENAWLIEEPRYSHVRAPGSCHKYEQASLGRTELSEIDWGY